METKQREIQTNRIDITKVKAIKVVKPEPEGRASPRIWKRLLVTAFSAFLVAAPLIAKDADAKGKKKHVEKPVAAEVISADAGLDGEAAPQTMEGTQAQPAAEMNGADAGAAAEVPAAAKQSEDEFIKGMLSDVKTVGKKPEPEPVAETKTEGGNVVTHNFVFPGAPKRQSEYSDPALETYPNNTHINGKPRSVMNPESGFDVGGNFIGNEAGAAGFMSARYRGIARLDTGALTWNGLPMLPFARLMVSPNLEIWRIKMGYYGSVGAIHGMPSDVYFSSAGGIGYSQPIGNNFRFRLGGVIGGSGSYPAWDNTHFSLSAGASMELFRCFTIYGVPTFYFAADGPIETAYIMNYKPRFQSMEFGIQGIANEYTARIFADIGLIRDGNYGISNKYGLQFIRTVRAGDKMDVDLWASIGMTQFSPILGGRSDTAVMIGANLVIGGKYMNSTNTFAYSHQQDASWESAETNFPDSDHPGPYAFGHSKDPYYDVPINDAKARMLNSGSFSEFKNGYAAGSLSTDEAIVVASFLGATLQRAAYANQAQEDLMAGNLWSNEAQRISSADSELIFQYLKGIVGWYETHGSEAPLPAELSNGIALCAGIHTIMADFMSANGVDSVVATVNTKAGMHVIAVGMTEDRTVLLDYGNTYTTPPDTLDQALRYYGQQQGAYTLQSQIFAKTGSDGKFHYIGTMDTSEGRLFRQVMGIDTKNIVLDEFLGIKQRQQ
jgi:hypothetical protein